MKKFKLPILLLAICLIVCLIGVMAACNGETATDGTQDNTDPILPSTPEEEKPQPTVEELSKAECENILQAKTQNLLSSVEVANKHEIEFLKSADFSADFTVSAVEITKVNLNGGEVYGLCTLTANADGTVHSVYFVLKTNLFSLDRTSYEVLKEELAYLNAYYVSVYENSADIPAIDGFFDFNSLVAGETVPSLITEEDYKEQCTEIINAIALDAVNKSIPSKASISNPSIELINLKTSTIYLRADYNVLGTTNNKLFILKSSPLKVSSYGQLSNDLLDLKILESKMDSNIQSEVSDEAYANLVNFVISNSIGWGPAGTDVEILNVSRIEAVLGGSGRSATTMYAIKNNEIYTITVESSSAGSQEDRIQRFLNEENLQSGYTTFTINKESFSDFNDIGK